MQLGDANVILAQEEPEAPFTLNRNKLPALHGKSHLQSTKSNASCVPVLAAQIRKYENWLPGGKKKIVDPPGTEETAPAPPEASDPISQITHLWLLETAFLGIKQFPKKLFL